MICLVGFFKFIVVRLLFAAVLTVGVASVVGCAWWPTVFTPLAAVGAYTGAVQLAEEILNAYR